MLLLAFFAAGCAENRTPYPTATDAGAIACVPNLDGQIEANEAPIARGSEIGYWISPAGQTRMVDLEGSVDDRGLTVWSFAHSTAGDTWTAAAIVPVNERWYAAEFPATAFAIPAAGLDSIYRKDESGLWLLGIASTEPDPTQGQTLLAYDEPVAVLRFPVAPDLAYIERGQVSSGTLNGLPYSGEDTYEIEARGVGELAIPGARFSQVHRIDTRVTVTPAVGGVSTSRRQTSYFFECFGEIVRATSVADEPERDFTTAASVRRLALSRPQQRNER